MGAPSQSFGCAFGNRANSTKVVAPSRHCMEGSLCTSLDRMEGKVKKKGVESGSEWLWAEMEANLPLVQVGSVTGLQAGG